MKIVPTDAQINEVAAELLNLQPVPPRFCPNCGFDFAVREVAPTCTECKETYAPHEIAFCTNRNLLPKLWQAAKYQVRDGVIAHFVAKLLYHTDADLAASWPAAESIMTAAPRLHVVAFLKALQAWPEEWEVEA